MKQNAGSYKVKLEMGVHFNILSTLVSVEILYTKLPKTPKPTLSSIQPPRNNHC